MIEIRPFLGESDFERMLAIESRICEARGMRDWQFHIGGLIFDRFLFGEGEEDIYAYGHLIYEGDAPVGYLLAYRDEGEFVLRLLPNRREAATRVLGELSRLFPDGAEYGTVLSGNERDLIDACLSAGFVSEGPEKYLGRIDLSEPLKEPPFKDADISILSEKDLPERARHAGLPMDHAVSLERMERYFRSPYHACALDEVLRRRSDGAFIGFITWWVDERSKTALLEPVACLAEFRGKGYMKNLILESLRQLKLRGIRCAYVGTSIDHYEAIGFYETCGFKKVSEGVKLARAARTAPAST